MDLRIRIEGTDPPVYLDGQGSFAHNVTVDRGDVVDVYLPVGQVDGETVYRLAETERK